MKGFKAKLRELLSTPKNIFAEYWNCFVQDDQDFLDQCRYGVHGNGTHVQMQGLGSWQTLDTTMGRWYRSKESIAGKNPYFGYLANKKWPMNEAITRHLLHFAQAGLITSEARMPEQPWEEKLEPLRMEHFYLSFAILGVGVGIAIVLFILELVFYKLCCKM